MVHMPWKCWLTRLMIFRIYLSAKTFESFEIYLWIKCKSSIVISVQIIITIPWWFLQLFRVKHYFLHLVTWVLSQFFQQKSTFLKVRLTQIPEGIRLLYLSLSLFSYLFHFTDCNLLTIMKWMFVGSWIECLGIISFTLTWWLMVDRWQHNLSPAVLYSANQKR